MLNLLIVVCLPNRAQILYDSGVRELYYIQCQAEQPAYRGKFGPAASRV